MPWLVQTLWNGRVHYAIEYGRPLAPHLRHNLSREIGRAEITHTEAALGLDELVRVRSENVGDYHGA